MVSALPLSISPEELCNRAYAVFWISPENYSTTRGIIGNLHNRIRVVVADQYWYWNYYYCLQVIMDCLFKTFIKNWLHQATCLEIRLTETKEPHPPSTGGVYLSNSISITIYFQVGVCFNVVGVSSKPTSLTAATASAWTATIPLGPLDMYSCMESKSPPKPPETELASVLAPVVESNLT